MEQNTITLALLMAAFGQIVLAVSLLVPRTKKMPVYGTLIVFFVTSGIAFTLPALNMIWPSFTLNSLYFLLPTITLQPVALWFYIKGLTSPLKWQFHLSCWPHFVPTILSAMLTLSMTMVPVEELEIIFLQGKEPTSYAGLCFVISFFALFVIYVIQVTMYLLNIVKSLLVYRQQLKMVFSSNEGKELLWILWLVLIIAFTWITTLVYLLPSFSNNAPLFDLHYVTLCYFILIWTLAVWGLRQKPGFDDRHMIEFTQTVEKETIEEIISPQKSKSKYKRSALSSEQSKRIADKLLVAMNDQQLYLQPDLSLPSLAKQLCVPANYLSQTLNESLNESFFDHVNSWRVKYSQKLIKETKQPLLDIAMNSGFNAKSSFYKAFKQHTGMTPGTYSKDKLTVES